MMPDYEILRERYRPKVVRVLFIGESRPAQGTFFYCQSSNLFEYTNQAFEQSGIMPFNLNTFMGLGCWLYDVCDQPVNNLETADRIAFITQGISALEKAIQDLSPEYIFVVKKGDFGRLVYPHVIAAGYIDNLTACSLPFPACGQQRRYVQELSAMLQKTILKWKRGQVV